MSAPLQETAKTLRKGLDEARMHLYLVISGQGGSESNSDRFRAVISERDEAGCPPRCGSSKISPKFKSPPPWQSLVPPLQPVVLHQSFIRVCTDQITRCVILI